MDAEADKAIRQLTDLDLAEMVRSEWQRRWNLRPPYHFIIHDPGDEEPWAQSMEWTGLIVQGKTRKGLLEQLPAKLSFYRLEADPVLIKVRPLTPDEAAKAVDEPNGLTVVEVKMQPIPVDYMSYEELKEHYDFADTRMNRELTMDERRELITDGPAIVKRLVIAYYELQRAYRDFVGVIDD